MYKHDSLSSNVRFRRQKTQECDDGWGGDIELDPLPPLPCRNPFGGKRAERGAPVAGYCSGWDQGLRLRVECGNGKSEQIQTYLGR